MAKMFQYYYFLANALVLLPLILQMSNVMSSKPTGFSLKVIPRDSPESPIYFGNITTDEKMKKMVEITRAKAHKMKLATSDNLTIQPQDAIYPLYRDSNFYIVEFMIGVPSKTIYLLMDTGGGLVWTQCMPCKNCYRQESPFYDSTTSTSYWKLPCSHFFCNGGPQSVFTCVNNECTYSITYGEGGSGPTKGIASVETVQFLVSTGDIQAIDGVVFGCSNDNVNFENFENTMVSGILGLSWAPNSLLVQLAPFVNGRFSYCFVPFDEVRPGPSKLSFGDAIPAPQGNILTTQFVRPPAGRNYFYLYLVDISVGWERLGFPADTFYFNDDGSGGYFIDSGAIISVLNSQTLASGRNPYKDVIAQFQKYYDERGLTRTRGDPSYELCYVIPNNQFQNYLTMTYHFLGADYIVDGKYAHYFNRGRNYFCVSLLGVDGMSVLGAWHQQNIRITYDGNIRVLQFSNEICT